MHMYIYTHIYTHVDRYTAVCMYIYIYICISMYVSMYICFCTRLPYSLLHGAAVAINGGVRKHNSGFLQFSGGGLGSSFIIGFGFCGGGVLARMRP